jgi:predicted ATP-grasp superfamily ATP-dependent carboligase
LLTTLDFAAPAMSEPLVILGASVRAAAASACRAGLTPYCGDLFADVDLRGVAVAVRVTDYPEGLADVARSAPPGWWMYTGGLENHPDLVDRIAAERPLAGNCGDVLRRVRDPLEVSSVLREAGLAVPAVSLDSADVPRDGSWLCKPLRSAGGRDIEHWRGGSPAGQHYYQQYIAGLSYSAVYLADGRRAALLGVTRQLVGTRWAGARPFHYAGSIGPIMLAEELVVQFVEIGRALTSAFGLVGLFGVDAIVAASTVWPVEVNPRITASAEILERGGNFSTIGQHLAACGEQSLPPVHAVRPPKVLGKAIYYAPSDLVIRPEFTEMAECELARADWPDLADVPAAGTIIRVHHPVCTVFAEGADEAAVVAGLRNRVQLVSERLAMPINQR